MTNTYIYIYRKKCFYISMSRKKSCRDILYIKMLIYEHFILYIIIYSIDIFIYL